MTATDRHVLIVHSAGDLGYLERLRSAGFRFTLMKKRPTEDDRRHFDAVIDWDYQEGVTESVDRIRRLHLDDPIAGVTSFSESGVVMAAILAGELGLPGNAPAAALRARNKYLMRRGFEAEGMANPPFFLVRTAEEIHAHVRAAGAPMVLKPISGSSSYGVIKVNPGDELGEIAREVNEITARLHETQTVLLRSEKLASIGTMASGIAHELNNPITGLQNCLTRIQANPDNAKQTEEYVELMLGTVRHMDATVSALLAFARKSAVELRTVDLRAVVHKAAELVAFRFERSRVEVACRMPDDAVNVRGDSATLTQVAVNLLANAVDAMPEGGAVTVALDAAEGRACLRVRDEGTGISAEDLEKIFDPFFTTKEAGQGTGLGLAVAHRVAVDHGGELRVSSRLGEGTEFVLCLPLLDQEQET